MGVIALDKEWLDQPVVKRVAVMVKSVMETKSTVKSRSKKKDQGCGRFTRTKYQN